MTKPGKAHYDYKVFIDHANLAWCRVSRCADVRFGPKVDVDLWPNTKLRSFIYESSVESHQLTEQAHRQQQRRTESRAGACGCVAAMGVLVFIGLPLFFIYSFGLSPCQHGPCDPNGASRLTNVGVIVLILAVAAGLSVRWLVKRR